MEDIDKEPAKEEKESSTGLQLNGQISFFF